MMSNSKRFPDDSSSPPNPSKKVFKVKHDDAPVDYSSDVRKKLQSSNRTGQACDRCRMRKMRCDGRPDGCEPCTQNKTACKTTDRMTGIANERGHVKRLEQRIREIESHIRGLEGRLMSVGEDVKPLNMDSHSTAGLRQWNQPQEQEPPPTWESVNASTEPFLPSQNTTPGSDGMFNRLPQFRHGLSGDNYLGVSSGNSFISSIRGTAMNVLGAEIDLADYMSADLDEPHPSAFGSEYPLNKSYHAFVQTAYGATPKPPKVQLPPRDEGMTYAQWYFRMFNPYMPFNHKPTFLSMLSRVYDEHDAFEPSVAEVVMIHMLLAIMYFQYAARNWENAGQQSGLNDISNRHYHYALSFLPQLMASHTLQDVQALTMIALHMRSFPKPGPCWMLSTTTLNLAIELGLHRSAKRWASTAPRKSTLEIEMRKRTFWSLFLMHVMTCGKLGRPIPLREEDFDVELPEPVDDDLLSEDGIDTSKPGKCDFLVAMESFKILPAILDLYRSVYSIKRFPQNYIDNVKRLEKRFSEWREQWPHEMKIRDITRDEEGRVHAQYLTMASLEFRLLLRHPSLSLTSSVEFNEENLTVCMEVSHQMLQHVKIIQKYKSLDTNWQSGALYVLAISTTLFGHWKRADQVTPSRLASLRKDLDDWLSILGDVSELLGSGKRLREAVRVTVDKTLYTLEQHLASKAASSADSSSDINTFGSVPSNDVQPVQHGAYKQPGNYVHYGAQPGNAGQNLFQPSNGSDITAQAAIQYTSPTQYSFPVSAASYSSNSGPYAPTAYTPSEPLSSGSQQATAAAANSYLYSSLSPSANTNYQPGLAMGYTAGPGPSWREWAGHMAARAGNMPSNPEPQEYLNSATALMQLGGRNGQGGDTTMQATIERNNVSEGVAQQWPMVVFDDSHQSG